MIARRGQYMAKTSKSHLISFLYGCQREKALSLFPAIFITAVCVADSNGCPQRSPLWQIHQYRLLEQLFRASHAPVLSPNDKSTNPLPLWKVASACSYQTPAGAEQRVPRAAQCLCLPFLQVVVPRLLRHKNLVLFSSVSVPVGGFRAIVFNVLQRSDSQARYGHTSLQLFTVGLNMWNSNSRNSKQLYRNSLSEIASTGRFTIVLNYFNICT